MLLKIHRILWQIAIIAKYYLPSEITGYSPFDFISPQVPTVLAITLKNKHIFCQVIYSLFCIAHAQCNSNAGFSKGKTQ